MMSKSNKIPSECKICSSPAFNFYYGVKSCCPCKVFFKRNAEKKILKCDFNDQCKINILNRHICSGCRLKKCFEVGMSTERIRPSRTKNIKKISRLSSLGQIKNEENEKPQQLRTLNLLEHDQSLLTNEQWNLLSNLIHSYDEHNALPIAKHFMKQLERLPMKLRFKIDSNKIVEIVTIFYQTTEPFIQSNKDFLSLSFHDRSIVLNGAIDNVSCLGGGFLLRQSELITNLAFRQGLEKTFGTIPYNLTLTVISLLDEDINIVKLTLALFAFCTTSCTLFNQNNSFMYIKDNQAFLRIQYIYAELIWKYLLYKYHFNQAVKRFSDLVKCLVLAITVRTHLQTVKHHTDLVHSLIQKIQQQQININDE